MKSSQNSFASVYATAKAKVFHQPQPVAEIGQSPFILNTPANLNTSIKDGFVFISEPQGEAANRYRKIATALAQGSWPLKRILITSATSGDGKTLTAVNLALALAERGHSVFLAELNLVRPRYRYVFGSPSPLGVESVLRGESAPEDATFVLGSTRIAIASVALPMRNNELLKERRNLDKLLEYGLNTYQWSILDVPPIGECSTIRELASKAGPVVMVARSRKTKLNVFRRAALALGSDLNYVLLNDVA
jgi:succinoglycan biosynthesis transport protein ExoP